jgi:hypothetical protein
MTDLINTLIDDLMRDMEPATLPGHPDGPRVVTMSVDDAVELIRDLASRSGIDHILVTDGSNGTAPGGSCRSIRDPAPDRNRPRTVTATHDARVVR